jgi:sugar phosphate isomerase/epimerase
MNLSDIPAPRTNTLRTGTLCSDHLVACAVPLAHIHPLNRLSPVRAAGFNGMSISAPDLWTLAAEGISAGEFGQRMRDIGLCPAEMECIVTWLPGHGAMTEAGIIPGPWADMAPRQIIASAVDVGCTSVTVAEIRGVRPSIDEAAESFAAICDLAADRGLTANIEFIPFGGIPNLTTAWRIVEAAGRANGGIMLDSWHLFRSGSTLDELARIPGDRIMVVQINDAPATPGANLFQESMSERLLPGDGDLDLVGMFKTLDLIGCTAPIGVEVFSDALRVLPANELLECWRDSARKILYQSRSAKRTI